MIGIFINPKKLEFKDEIQKLIDKIISCGIKFSLNEDVSSVFSKKYVYEKIKDIVTDKDIVIIVGGDGTFLHFLHSTGFKKGKYILANVGYIGFLSSFSLKDLTKNLIKVINSKDKYTQLPLLEIVYKGKKHHAVNDIVFEKDGASKLIGLKLYVNNVFYHYLRASGLILSTSTGSSAFCYSSGGPIVELGLDVIVYKAISPQFNGEPSVVFKGRHTFKVENNNEFPLIFTLDGLKTVKIDPSENIEIRLIPQAEFNLVLYKSKDINAILKEKLFKKI